MSVYKCLVHPLRVCVFVCVCRQAAREFYVYFQFQKRMYSAGVCAEPSLCPLALGPLPSSCSVCLAKGCNCRQLVYTFLANTHCAWRKIFCTCRWETVTTHTHTHTHLHICFSECAILSRLSCHCATVCHKWQSHSFHGADVRSNAFRKLIYRNSLALLLINAINSEKYDII